MQFRLVQRSRRFELVLSLRAEEDLHLAFIFGAGSSLDEVRGLTSIDQRYYAIVSGLQPFSKFTYVAQSLPGNPRMCSSSWYCNEVKP